MFRLNNLFLALALLFTLIAVSVNGQITITMVVTDYEVDIQDRCDACCFGGRDSDPRWCFNGDMNGNCETISNCSGCYPSNPPNITIYNESFDCLSDLPSSLRIDFEGCEDDPVGCESRANSSLNVPVPAIGSSAPFNGSASSGGSCPGNYRYNGTITVSGSPTTPPPANDAACGAITMPANGTVITGSNTCATTQAGEPNAGAGNVSPDRTVWYRFQAPPNEEVTISTNHGATNFDTEIALYHSPGGSCAFSNFSYIDADDDIVVVLNLDSRMTVDCLEPGDWYYIQVDGNDRDDFGNFGLSVSPGPGPQATNDNICDAFDIGTLNLGGTIDPPATTAYNNFCAGTQPGEPSPFGLDQTTWASFTTGATVGTEAEIEIENDPSSHGDQIDIQVALYESSGGCSFSDLTLVDDATPATFGATLGVECLQPNTTYYIQVDGAFANRQGYYGIEVRDNGIPKPSNDDICNATNIGLLNLGGTLAPATTTAQNNFCAGTQSPEPNASWGEDQTVWATFTTGAAVGAQADIDVSNDPANFGDDLHVQVALYASDGGCSTGDLTLIDSQGGASVGSTNMTVNCLEPNTIYYVQIDGTALNTQGFYGIEVRDNGAPQAPNDDICDFVDMGSLPHTPGISQTINAPGANNLKNLLCASVEPGEPDPSSHNLDATVWYSFTTPAALGWETLFEAQSDPYGLGENPDLQIALYTSSDGTCNGTLSEVASDYDPVIFSEDLTVECLEPNTRYFIQIDPGGIIGFGDEGFFELSITDDGVTRAPNDLVCNATPLGTIPDNGNSFLGNQNNYCAGVSVGEPDPSLYNLHQTVWYSFTPPTSGNVEIEALNTGPDFIDLEATVWESDDNTCTGNFFQIDAAAPGLIGGTNPSIDNLEFPVKCLDPTKTYFLQIDGTPQAITPAFIEEEEEGTFDIDVIDYVPSAPNDLICDAIDMGTITNGGTSTLIDQNNFCADNVFDPVPSDWGPLQTVWYSFVAPPSGHVLIDADSDVRNYGEDIWLKLAVYSTSDNTCTGSFTEIKSEFNDPITEIGFDEEMDVPCLEPGRRYWIMVDGADVFNTGLAEVDGWFDITINGEFGTPLANDNICQAIALGDPTGTPINSGEYHNFCATEEPGEPDPHILNEMQTTWFTFTAPASGNILIEAVSDPNNNGDNLSMGLGIFQSDDGTCTGNLLEVDAEFTLPLVTFDEDIYVDCLTPGEEYYLQVDGAARDPLDILTLHEGYFDLTLTEEPGYGAVPNDDICNATDMGSIAFGGSSALADEVNFCATQEAGEPDVSGGAGLFGESYDETVWYKFTTSGTPGAITIDVTDATDGLAPQMNVYIADNPTTCDFNEITPIYQNNNIIPGVSISETIDCPKSETTYYLQIDGADLPDISTIQNLGDDGTFDLTITDDGTPPSVAPNDDICNADVLGSLTSGGSIATSSDNFCSTEEGGEPNVSGSGLYDNINYDETVWFKFVTSATPGDADVTITNTSGSLVANFVLYEAADAVTCDFSQIQEIDQSVPLGLTDAQQTFDCLRPNTTYYIQMDGSDLLSLLDNQGTFDLDIVDNGVPNTFPANDSYCTPTNLGIIPEGGSSSLTTENNFCATEETGEPNVSGGSVPTNANYDETVWYTFTTPANPGLTNISITNTTGIDANVNVYLAGEACNFSQLTEISSQAPITSSDVDLDLPCLPPNTRYAIQVDGDDVLGNEGTFDISVSDDGSANAYPNNDDICNAVNFGTLASGGSTALTPGDNNCATEETGEPNVSGSTIITSANYDETLWYAFTTSGTPGTITVDVINTTGIDANVTAYIANSGNCTFANLDQERSTLGALNGDASLELVCLNPNTTYYIQVDGDDVLGNRGTFDIQITDDGVPTPDPVNDDICFATNLGSFVGGSVGPIAGNNACADVEPGEPNVSGNDESVWYAFTAPTSGQATIDIDAIQYIWPTFRIYHQTQAGCLFNTLSELSGPHIGINPLDPDVSHTETCLIPGETYYIQVDGLDVVGDDGDFSITITDADPTYAGGPANNDCGNAIPIPVEPEPCQGTGDWQTESYGNNPTVSENTPFTQACGENCGDIWYSFTLPASGTALIEGDDEIGGTLGTNSSTLVVAAYNGDCSNLNPLGCDDGGFGIGGNQNDVGFYVNGTPGETIYLQAWDDGGDDLDEDFNICASFRCGPDDCDVAQLMDFGIPYCFDTDGATGEDPSTDPGYRECGQGFDPDQSVYYTFRTPFGFETSCGEFTVNVQASVGGICLPTGDGVPTDYLSMSIYQDSTPCDFDPDLQVDCKIVSNCEVNGVWNFTKTYTNLEPNMNYTIMMDASTLGAGNHDGTITVSNTCPLAIDGLTFDGQALPNQINKLYWNTVNRKNIVNWSIERGTDPTAFSEIGTLNGNLYDHDAQFEFYDHDPEIGLNYYRLRAHSLDGTTELSEAIAIMVQEPKNVSIMKVYPNPASSEVNIDMLIPEAGDYEVEIYDLVGKRVFNKTQSLSAGEQSLILNINDISASVYIVKCTHLETGYVDQAKFVKQ